MNADIYERHRQAVETWRVACQNVEFAEKQRDEARQALDNATAEIAASCANSVSKPEKKTRRGRKPKAEQNAMPEGAQAGMWAKKFDKPNGDARETV